MKNENSLDHVLKYTGLFGGVQGLTLLMSIVRNRLASEFLGAIGIALMGIYLSVAEFVRSSSNFGIPFSAVRRLSELYEEEQGTGRAVKDFVRVIRTWSMWTACLAVVVCVAASPLLARFFSGQEHQVDWSTIALLAPMVFAGCLEAGECSILKATRRLKRIAIVETLCAATTLMLTVPFFWAWHIQGIIVALDLSTLAVLAIHLCYSLPLYPYHIGIASREVFVRGWELVRVGIPYVLAAIAGSGVALALPALFIRFGSMEDVGFYRVGYTLMVTYAGIVFTAFEADYFPRLSGVNHDPIRRNATINDQIRVCLLLIAPLLIALMVMMPVVIHILYAKEFMAATSMTICAAFYMFLRSITTPISYTALACGDSMVYLLMEIIYDAISLAIIVLCYVQWGLMGAGIGLSLSALFDLIMIGTIYGWHYRFRLTRSTLALAIEQGLLVGATMALCLLTEGVTKYVVGALLVILSAWRSCSVLARETTIIQRLKRWKP